MCITKHLVMCLKHNMVNQLYVNLKKKVSPFVDCESAGKVAERAVLRGKRQAFRMMGL